MPLPERALSVAFRLATETVAIEADHEYAIAGIYSFGRGLIRRPTIRGSETAYTKLARLRAGQFMMSKLNGWEGALTVVPDEFDGSYVSPEYPVFDINTEVADPGYIGYLAKWPSLWDRLTPRGSMVRRKRTVPATLLATPVPLPDLPEQRRITARLDASFDKLSRAASLRERRSFLQGAVSESAIGEAAAQRIISASISSILTRSRVPVEIDPGKRYQAFGMRSFGKGSIRYEETEGRELSRLRYYRFPTGALALSNIKAWEGAIGVTDAKDTACVASNRFLFYTPRDQRINISYLRYYLLSRAGLAQVAASSPGSADRNRTLSIKGFEAIEVPLPRREVQDRTAHLIGTLGYTSGDRSTEDAWQAIRTALLNAAFAGQL
jgi:type I restriction enzyme, S subunit